MKGAGIVFEYKAHITKVYDGDTVTADVDLGFSVVLKGQKLRLIGINAPEIRGAEREKGLLARDRLRELILDKDVIIKTYKDKRGKYGRWLADIQIGDILVCETLLSEGLATHYAKR